MTQGSPPTYLQRLLHRWLVQYNPLYLLSATLVLGGMTLVSRSLAQEGNLTGALGVSLVAEVYGLALIGGAALLTRVGLRRPGVLLALLAVLFQGDLSAHTETSAYLGGAGVAASGAWLAVFALKLRALAWAMKLRISPRATATVALGAIGLAAFPHLLGRVSPGAASAAIAAWLFVLGATCRGWNATSLVPLDAWGETVRRRSVRAAACIWGALALAHVAFWTTQHELHVGAMLPALPLALVVHGRRETRLWAAVASTLALTACLAPHAFALTSLLASIVLGLRSIARVRTEVTARASALPVQPYRVAEGEPPPAIDEIDVTFAPLDFAARIRLWSGALTALYLAAAARDWSGGPFPAHELAIDAGFAVVMLALAWRLRARTLALPPALVAVHAAIAARLVPAPRSPFECGVWALGVGFALLFASVGATYALRHMGPTAGRPAARSG